MITTFNVADAYIGGGKYGSSSANQIVQRAMEIPKSVITTILVNGTKEEPEMCLLGDRLNKVGTTTVEPITC